MESDPKGIWHFPEYVPTEWYLYRARSCSETKSGRFSWKLWIRPLTVNKPNLVLPEHFNYTPLLKIKLDRLRRHMRDNRLRRLCFLFLLLNELDVIWWDSLEHANIAFDHLENFVTDVTLDDNLLKTLGILSHRCTSCEF